MNEVMFICGKCGVEVDKEATVCHKCGAKLGNIRCPFCKYTGIPASFKNDRCPRCGKNRNLKINLKSKKITKKKLTTISDDSPYEADDFIAHYFPLLFIILLVATGSILIFFLKHFNFI
ncbi:MAG: hypothetical protein A2015_07025 [Spirochaetes bacterium GWF1_31_7]|nr:MAG: hypothetical protein A2Y30_09435 [Spirochaetes bacterium GWE1_32_154]OHD46582.1 MAG: hypothetical protein A2015_07025 [Spirochaetes bacterium GWF1_31_7]OHD48980.1 MAG: hypothetical protein A2Y29_17055 [Spirochaetes bacterium GWE2_31_10]OHD78957.1 MAG: hypothetical protein A2355_08955 [Spirochaetes bacterium RIFOXYB1_FULL_32_8]HBD93133.1 hypothetical protein [Spirochaetia bacterium]